MIEHRTPPTTEAPIACTLSDPERIARQETLSTELFARVEEVQECADGYAFRFPADAEWAAKLTAFALFERECCPFFTFELIFAPNYGPLWLRLRGGEGVKQFIAQMRIPPSD
ncbi:MAG: hypothetical protein LC793_07750 [Thermomicrobia bacterium]|nr:hypothetical protein [Thermomicrobia bacterium]